ncbi:hypothetical protein HUU42_01695 [bacterium]|nr:hypothetical protein [bacterium]
MENSETHNNVVDPKTENPKTLKIAAGVLFALGLIASLLFYVQDNTNKMILYAAFFLSLGYPGLNYARALEKIARLEKRVRDLENKTNS